MASLPQLLLLIHLIGLGLGLGSASVKLMLLLKCKADNALVPTYLKVARPITRLIVLGLVLLTLSGIGWLLLGYSLTQHLIIKLILVGFIWVLGPIIDHVVEPNFRNLAPGSGQLPSQEFARAHRQYLAFEMTATGMFYVIVVMWLLL